MGGRRALILGLCHITVDKMPTFLLNGFHSLCGGLKSPCDECLGDTGRQVVTMICDFKEDKSRKSTEIGRLIRIAQNELSLCFS